MKARLLLILLAALSLASCNSVEVITLSKPTGFVADVRGHVVDVCYPIVTKDEEKQFACHSFYLEGGHSFKTGDKYPDITKYNYEKINSIDRNFSNNGSASKR